MKTSVRLYHGAFSVIHLQNRSIQFPTFIRFFTSPAEKLTLDGLDELPFNIKDGSLEKGYLTLIREYRDEVIEVKVRPCYQERYVHYKVPEEIEDTWRLFDRDDDRAIKFLYMLVTIKYGNGYNKCEKYFGTAYPTTYIGSMSSRVEEGTKHLEEFEEIFNQKVIQPSQLDSNSTDVSTFCSLVLDHFKSKKENKIENPTGPSRH